MFHFPTYPEIFSRKRAADEGEGGEMEGTRLLGIPCVEGLFVPFCAVSPNKMWDYVNSGCQELHH